MSCNLRFVYCNFHSPYPQISFLFSSFPPPWTRVGSYFPSTDRSLLQPRKDPFPHNVRISVHVYTGVSRTPHYSKSFASHPQRLIRNLTSNLGTWTLYYWQLCTYNSKLKVLWGHSLCDKIPTRLSPYLDGWLTGSVDCFPFRLEFGSARSRCPVVEWVLEPPRVWIFKHRDSSERTKTTSPRGDSQIISVICSRENSL